MLLTLNENRFMIWSMALKEKTISLGTVQLGMDYGVANKVGAPTKQMAIQLLQCAYDNGIRSYDTARAYGDAEQKVGAFLAHSGAQDVLINTKLKPIESKNPYEEAINSIESSLTALGVDKVDVLLFHRWKNKQLSQVMRAVKEKSQHYQRLGVSALDYSEAIEALQDNEITYIQLPCNILDWRSRAEDFLVARQKRPDVHIQVRSGLLQGVLTQARLSESFCAQFPMVDDLRSKVLNIGNAYGLNRIEAIAFAYLNSLDWVDGIVFGVDSKEQLLDTLRIVKQQVSVEGFRQEVARAFTALNVDLRLLMPHLWGLSR